MLTILLLCSLRISLRTHPPHLRPPAQTKNSPEAPQQPPPPTTSQPSPARSDLQAQLLEIESTLASPFDKVRALEKCLTEQDVSKREVEMLRELLEKGARGWDTQDP